MQICTRCKGSGKIVVTGGTYGKPSTSVSIKCIDCRGKGSLTEAEAKSLKDEADLWCSCGNPSQETVFFDDGMHPQCSKHCWTCQDCGKITQIG